MDRGLKNVLLYDCVYMEFWMGTKLIYVTECMVSYLLENIRGNLVVCFDLGGITMGTHM